MCVSYILTECFKYEILTKLLPTAKLGGFILYCFFISTVASYGLFASLSTFLKQDMGRYLQPILKHMLETLRSTEGFVVSCTSQCKHLLDPPWRLCRNYPRILSLLSPYSLIKVINGTKYFYSQPRTQGPSPYKVLLCVYVLAGEGGKGVVLID